MKIFAFCLKAIRRTLVVVFGATISTVADSMDRAGLLYWPFLSEALGVVPFTFGWQLRQDVYSRLGICRGANSILNHGTTLGDRRSTIGGDVWTARDVYIEYAHIGDHALIGPGAVLLAGSRHHKTDRLDIPIKSQGNNPLEAITIGEGAWIGANATIMADVGSHAIVGAGSVVLKPVPDYAVVAGNPARFIRDRRQLSDAKDEAVEEAEGKGQAAVDAVLLKTR